MLPIPPPTLPPHKLFDVPNRHAPHEATAGPVIPPLVKRNAPPLVPFSNGLSIYSGFLFPPKPIALWTNKPTLDTTTFDFYQPLMPMNQLD